MSILQNMQLKTKLFLLVASAALGVLILGVASYLANSSGAMTAQTRIYDDVNAATVLPDANVVKAHVIVCQMLATRDRETRQKLAAKVKSEETIYASTERQLLAGLPDGKTKELIQGKAHQQAAEYFDFLDQQFIPMVLQNDTTEEVQRLLPRLMSKYEASEAAVAEMVQADTDEGQAARDHVASTIGQRSVMLVVLGIVLVAVISALGFVVSHGVTRGITGILSMVQEIAANNLTVSDIEVTTEDELGQAGLALNSMKNNLCQIIQSIAGTAEHVASASEELSSSATQQAQGAETQNSQTTQVATAMQEMTSTVLQVSENSNKAAESSRRAAETARQGGDIVKETLNRMRAIATSVSGTAKQIEELGKSSDQIGRIIGVIDDIADQTNLLALNAAIEAARAGEQGRGFAVVADEVRKLAERTTTATKEIAQMIKTVQDETKTAVTAMEAGTKQVEEGVQTTTQAGDSLKQIIQVSEEVGEMITHIATAATEQSSATEEINNNMDQISKLVKESADGAQQSAKACQDLSGLALDLQKMVSNFKLEDGNGRKGTGTMKLGGYNVQHKSQTPLKALAAVAR